MILMQKNHFFRIKGANFITSLLLWFNRKNTMEKIKYLLTLDTKNISNTNFREKYENGFLTMCLYLVIFNSIF